MTSPRWRTEPLTPAHSDVAAALYRLFFPNAWDRPWSGDEVAALLATPGCFGHLLLESAHDAARGFVLLRAAADEAEILTLGVVPARHRQGGGAHLLARATAACAARGVRSLFLEVAADNEPARRLYERHGFSATGTRPSYYARGAAFPVAALVMKCPIVRK